MADENSNRPDGLAALLAAWPGLNVDDCRAIAALPHTIRTYEPGQYLLREGDRVRTCTVLIAGFVYRHKIVGDGGRQIVSINLSGDIIDLQNILLSASDHNIQALTTATVAILSPTELLQLAFQRPAIGKVLWTQALIESSLYREWIANVGRRDARARTAHLLCELAIRQEHAGLGPRESFELPMTQEQLGDALGLTAVHVNRTLKSLQNDGLIHRSKRALTVADWSGLSQVADFTTQYLHLISDDAH